MKRPAPHSTVAGVPHGSSSAVVAAHHAAGIARLTGWTPDVAPAPARPAEPDDRPMRERIDHILRVGADLREYALQLAEGGDRRVGSSRWRCAPW